MTDNKNNITIKENEYLREKYYHVKHKSGLNIYVFPKELTTAYAIFATKYGSIDNKFKISGDDNWTEVPDGIAHFLEHKMFENEDGVDTFALFAKTGASANAYTSFNKTAYLFSATEKVYESLEILLDYVTHPYFTPETVQKEQGIIAQEIRMGEDNPGRALIFGLLKSLYKNHAVRLEIAGTVDSISKITSDVLYKCYNTFYNLNNMSLIVCGDVIVSKIIEAADKKLTVQPDNGLKSIYANELPEAASPVFRKKMQVSKPLFAFGVKDIDISSDPFERVKKDAALQIINNILFGKSSPLFISLYEGGLISSPFDCWCTHEKTFSFSCISGESDDPDTVYQHMKDYINKIKSKGIDKGDFERNKRVQLSQYVKSFDSTDNIANNMLDSIIDGSDIFDYGEAINTLDYDYTLSVIRSYFNDEYYSFAVIEPLDEAMSSKERQSK